jgi:hypothetical protein
MRGYRVRLQLFKANGLKHVRVRRFQVHSQRNVGLQCLLPTSHTKAPPLALLQREGEGGGGK